MSKLLIVSALALIGAERLLEVGPNEVQVAQSGPAHLTVHVDRSLVPEILWDVRLTLTPDRPRGNAARPPPEGPIRGPKPDFEPVPN